jgi:hypothetical protein
MGGIPASLSDWGKSSENIWHHFGLLYYWGYYLVSDGIFIGETRATNTLKWLLIGMLS